MISSQTSDKPNASTKKYRWIGNYVKDFQSGDKVLMTEPGGVVNLTEEDLKNYKEWTDSGLLLEATGGK